MTPADYVGEIIESSSNRVVAQLPHRRDIQPPAFGCWVRMDPDRQVLGIVYNVMTTGVDANRQPVAYGIPLDELDAKMPHLFELQRTNFEISIIGYQQGGQVYYHTPPLPPRLHARVYLLSTGEIQKISENLAFLRMILANPNVPTDELIAAVIRQTAPLHPNPQYRVQVGKELSQLLSDDYPRLKSVLQRLV
ncbi:MAG: hypothetical protein D6675_09510 [Gemmatimonadetes bacterium]|nr:MAG: hypothetical protein D6675_09510 [Gemmatimonadota bacterium]